MNKNTALLLVCLSLTGCAQTSSVTAQQKNQSDDLLSFCATASHNTSHTVMIDDVTALAHHRDGKIVIQRQEGNNEIHQHLLRIAQNVDVYAGCMEYLSTSDLMTTEHGDKVLARVYFDFDSQNLTAESRRILKHVADKLMSHPDTIVLQGHTDAVGSVKYNYALGLRRAASTEAFLQKNAVKPAQLKAISYGETRPIAPNNTYDGRKQNRRVDLTIER